MRALVKAEAAPGMVLREVAAPNPGDGEVLVRVLRTGICGTDLHILRWDSWAQAHVRPPRIVGHEFVGEVTELGAGVGGLAIGDLISGEGHIVCGQCRNCMAGRRHLCANTDTVGVTRDGAFAEYVAIPASNGWKHDPDIDLDVAAIFDPFGNAVHTATAFPVMGEDVLITGAGPIGLMAAVVVRHAGARHVVVTDLNDYRLDLAHKVGVTAAVDLRHTSVADEQRRLGMLEGFDVVLEMSGQPSALTDMVTNMRHGGRIALLGLPATEFGIDWSRVVQYMLTIQGIYGRQMYETWYEMSVLVQQGVDISPTVTHRFPAEAYDEAFSVLRDGSCGKIILDWER